MATNTRAGGVKLRAKDTETASEAGRLLGSITTPKKREASRQNILAAKARGKVGGRPTKPLTEIPCRCEAGEALEGHRWDCPRGQAIKRRRKAGTL
jgi:hypothetical protein